MSKYTYHIRGHGRICIATKNKTEQIYATKIPSNIEIFTYTSIGSTMIEDECRTGSYDYVCNYMKPHLKENTLIKLQTPIYKYKYKNIGEENSNSYLFPEVVLFQEPKASLFTYGIIHCNPTNNEQVVIKKITGQYSLSEAIIEIQNDCETRYIDYHESTIQINLGSCLSSLSIDPKTINLPTNILVSIDTFEKYLYEDTSNIYSYFYKNITFIITSNTDRSSNTGKWQLYYDCLMDVNQMFIDTYGELTTILNPISCPIDLTTTADNKEPIIEKIQNEFMNFVKNNNLVSKYKSYLNLNIELTHDILIENESLENLNTSIGNAYHKNANHMNKKVSIALKASELNKSTKELTEIIDDLIKSKIDTQDSITKPKPEITLPGRDKTLQEVMAEAKEKKLTRQAEKAKAREAEEAKAKEAEQAKAKEAEEAEEAEEAKAKAREAEEAEEAEAREAKAREAKAREAEEAKAKEAEEAKKKGQQPRTNKRQSIFGIFGYKPKKYATSEVRVGGKKLSHKSKKFRKRHRRISIKRRLRTPKRIPRRIPRRIII